MRRVGLCSLLCLSCCDKGTNSLHAQPSDSSSDSQRQPQPHTPTSSAKNPGTIPTAACALVLSKRRVGLIRARSDGVLNLQTLPAHGPLSERPRILHTGFGNEKVIEIKAASRGEEFGVLVRSVRGKTATVRFFQFGTRYNIARPPSLVAGPAPFGKQHREREGYLHLRNTENGYASFFVSADNTCAHDPTQGCLQIESRHHPSQRMLRPTLSLPRPCQRPLVGFRQDNVFHHYAVCSFESGRPVTTLFSAQRRPAYAQADERLFGCEPVGLIAADSNDSPDGWLIGNCSGKRRALGFHGIDVDERAKSLLPNDIGCDADNHIRIQRLGDNGSNLLLRQPATDLASLLDLPRLGHTRRSAAAVYNGNVLFVASLRAKHVKVSRIHCDNGILHVNESKPGRRALSR